MRARDWEEAASYFFGAYVLAYGISGTGYDADVPDVEGLELELGLDGARIVDGVS